VKSADLFDTVILLISLLLYRTASKLKLWDLILIHQKQFDPVNGKYPTFVDLVILNPTITVILIAKFNPIIIAYLVPYNGMTITNFGLLKVKHISYNMVTSALLDMYTLVALGQVCTFLLDLGQVHIHLAKHLCPWYDYHEP